MKIITTPPNCFWREEDSIIYFPVMAEGTTGKQWAPRLEKKGFGVGPCGESILRSDNFQLTDEGVHEVAVLPGTLFSKKDRTTKNICAVAEERKLEKPKPDIACLVREVLNKESAVMKGIKWIIFMHVHIKNHRGYPSLLTIGQSDNIPWLNADHDDPDITWDSRCGFAFVVPRVIQRHQL